MKVLLIAGGVLFLLLSFALIIAAIIVFFMARKRGAAQPAAAPQRPPAPTPAAQPPAAQTPTPQPSFATMPVAQPSAPEGDGTVVVDTRRRFGVLNAISGPLAGRLFPIPAEGFFIGRDDTLSQVVIELPSVSKRHVWIGLRDGAIMAIDQKSTNGTFLNSPQAAIAEARLSPGDTLIISQDVARFRYEI